MKSFILVAVVFLASAYAVPVDEVPIVRSASTADENGYSYSYETGNGIKVSETGRTINAGTDEQYIAVEGSYSYTDPEGKLTVVKYTAGENGYAAEGDHFPVAPEVPPQILRALEYIAAHPSKEVRK